MGFHRRMRDGMKLEGIFPNIVTPLEGLIDIPEFDMPRFAHIVLDGWPLMDLGGAVPHRLFRVKNRRKNLILHIDEV